MKGKKIYDYYLHIPDWSLIDLLKGKPKGAALHKWEKISEHGWKQVKGIWIEITLHSISTRNKEHFFIFKKAEKL